MERYLNVKKLLDSDFFDRFIGFAERYEKIIGNPLVETARKWIDEQNFENIRHFLNSNHFEYILPFSTKEFITMDSATLSFYQDYLVQRCAILDEKKSLYDELLEYYN